MPHLAGYKCRVRSCRQQPAGKSMPRMVRITAANTSTFYCCIPPCPQTAYRVIRFLFSVTHPGHENKMQFLLFGSAVLPMIKGDFAFAMMPGQFVLLFSASRAGCSSVTVRIPAFVFGGPNISSIVRFLLTFTTPFSKSTSSHARAASSP